MKQPPLVQSTFFGGRANSTRVVLVAVLIAMTHPLGHAQTSSAPPEVVSTSSITTNDGFGGTQTSSIRGGADQERTSPCTLRLPEVLPESPAKADDAITMNAPGPYTPLSARCKFNLFLKQTYSPYTFVSAGFQATIDQAQGQWPHYGGGMQGWGKRFGATLADTESRRLIQTFALSTILHQDPRYFPSHQRTFISRALYAATRVTITMDDSGNETFNSSEFLGALFASSLQNSYYPRQDRNLRETMNRFGGALGSDAIGNLLREFTPDMKRLFRKHAPKRILRICDRLPIPAEDKP
jgi:hypothetical protein